MARIVFITHPEVLVVPERPVSDWSLSAVGEQRMRAFAELPLCQGFVAVYASAERKAQHAAELLVRRWQLPLHTRPALGENDRSSTGYLPPPAFEAAADAFFAHPEQSFRGWETAQAAQARIVAALGTIADEAPDGDIAIVAHGGVGTLYKCHLKQVAITRAEDQPRQGHYYIVDRDSRQLVQDWTELPGR